MQVRFSVTLHKCEQFPDTGFTVHCTATYCNTPHGATCPGEEIVEDIVINSISDIWTHYSSSEAWMRTPEKAEHEMALRAIRKAVEASSLWQSVLMTAAQESGRKQY